MSANPNPKTILRAEEVLHRTGVKRTMLYDLIKKGAFPKQVSLGARAVGWYEEEVETWVRNRRAGARESEWSGQIIAGAIKAVPTLKTPHERILTASPQQDLPKRSAAPAIPPSMARVRVTRRAPALSFKAEDNIEEPMSESEELKLLRKENAHLKKLVGELVLKNSLLQSSAGFKASAF